MTIPRTLASRRPLPLLAFAVAATACATLRAGVAWENVRVEKDAEAGAAEVWAEYRFRVSGPGTLRVVEVDTGCACADAELKKREFEAGEQGVLRVRLDVGDREGLFSTPILVRWRQGETASTDTLFLRVNIPVLATFDRRVLMFARGNPRAASLEIRVAPELGITLAVGETVGGYAASLDRGKEGTYVLGVRPGAELHNGFVDVVARRGGADLKKWRVFLRVRD